MKSILSAAGVLLAILLIAFLNSEWGKEVIADLLGGSKQESSSVIADTLEKYSTQRGRPLQGDSGVVGGTPPLLSRRSGQIALASGQFRVRMGLSINPGQQVAGRSARVLLSDSGVIQGIASDLNQALILPRDIPVILAPCGAVNAYYDLAEQSIHICDEFLALLGQMYKADKSGQEYVRTIVSTAGFVFAHEVGHALIHQYGLKFVGREEDVADQFAVFLLVGTPTGEKQALAAADSFGRLAMVSQPITWDNHSLSEQRRYNIFCWMYGSDPQRYQSLVTLGILPARRAETCQDEFLKMDEGLQALLGPHVR